MVNETAIVTGSTSGIGKKIAELYLREGCKVAICSRKEAKVSETLAEFKKDFGDSVIGMACDVSDPNAVKSLVDKTINEFGSIRILVTNAGINLKYGPFEHIPLEEVFSDAQSIIGVNLIGTINSVAAVLPIMIKQKYGRIITVGGGGADRPIEHMTIYSASKGGVLSFSRCLAKELGTKGLDIKINIFNPGMINTNLTKGAQVIDTWKDSELHERQMDLLIKHVMTDVTESSSKTIPYALSSCKDNGEAFRGFSLMKLIGGFRKVRKEMKQFE
ncbi:MAG: SDR family NAD(P)-dependent oxidoreductase [Promethearchaeota archaeon]|jgi:NAD(P)-dependent dehydrogenase (short-subunit alcohol dehydrogenase family)